MAPHVPSTTADDEACGGARACAWSAACAYDDSLLCGVVQRDVPVSQRMLNTKAMTVEQFTRMKEEFACAVASVSPLLATGGGHALRSQADVFRDADLSPGLEMVCSPFDLVEAMPIVGVPLRIKRFEGSKQNPWLVQVWPAG